MATTNNATPAPARPANALQLLKKDTVDVVAAKIRQFQSAGELHFPKGYSPDNAMKSAWLMLQETVDRNKKPALSVCTKDSIANACLNMVVQGLNPAKKQCYFIVYGDKLTLSRSYFGDMHIAKTVDPNITEILYHPRYANEDFSASYVRGHLVITEHCPIFDEAKRGDLIGAYCQIFYNDGTESSTYMTMEEIKAAWKKSPTNPIDENGNVKPGSTHAQFPADMACKTVVHNACKPIINSSGDDTLLIRAYRATAAEAAEAEALEEIAENANQTPLIVDADTGEVVEGTAAVPQNTEEEEDDLP